MASFASNAENKHEVSLDFQGNPADKSTKTGGWLAALLILGIELARRLIVIVISINLVTYLRGEMHLNSSISSNIVTNFMGSLNILTLLGGFLADAKLGRFLTIVIFSSTCALGSALLALFSKMPHMRPPPCDVSTGQNCIEANTSQMAMLYIALYTVALGGGGIKSNVSGFGSDQFDKSNPEEEKAMDSFNRFYFCVTLGLIFAVTILVYIEEQLDKVLGYGISAGAMLLFLILLLSGKKLYRYKKPQGSPLTIIGRVIFLAWKNRNLHYPDHPIFLNGYGSSKVGHTHNFRCLDKAAILVDCNTNEERNTPPIVSTVNEIEEVKMVIKLIPIWSTFILFWTIYSQISTFTIQQASIMNRKILPGFIDIIIPAGSYSVFLSLSVLLVTTLNERVVFPIAKKITHNPKGLSSLQRIGIGLVFSVSGMVVASIIEKRRREMNQNHGFKISAFWLFPQYFLVGAGDAFAYVAMLEFFITEAHERMKSMSTGLFSTTLAMGYFMSSVLVSITNNATHGSWIENLDQGKLDNFYWVLAILGVFNFLIFLILASRYKYNPTH